jgi:hypothetical protein
MIVSYELYKKQAKIWYGNDVENIWKYSTLLKLSDLIVKIDDTDIKTMNEIKEMLEKIQECSLTEKPLNFIGIMEKDIVNLVKKFNINESVIKESTIKYRIKKYAIVMIFIINSLIAIYNYLLK